MIQDKELRREVRSPDELRKAWLEMSREVPPPPTDHAWAYVTEWTGTGWVVVAKLVRVA